MIDITTTERYSDAHDEAMRTTLEVIKGAYNQYSTDKPYSVSLPNDATEQRTVSFYDGDQSSYNSRRFEDLAKNLGIEGFSCISDYPRYNDTLRFKFTEEADAQLFVKHARLMCGLEQALTTEFKA